jgi:hypothetical protein
MQRSPEETREIERHKYFLSEKHGHDVGWEFAAQDWEQQHAARWRREQLRLLEPSCSEDDTDGGCCSQPASSKSAVSSPMTSPLLPEAGNGHRHDHNDLRGRGRQESKPVTGAQVRRGPLRRLLSRLFRQAS